MYDVIYEAEIALCNINKQPLQLNMEEMQFKSTFILEGKQTVLEL
jgi:hypothetical protein